MGYNFEKSGGKLESDVAAKQFTLDLCFGYVVFFWRGEWD